MLTYLAFRFVCLGSNRAAPSSPVTSPHLMCLFSTSVFNLSLYPSLYPSSCVSRSSSQPLLSPSLLLSLLFTFAHPFSSHLHLQPCPLICHCLSLALTFPSSSPLSFLLLNHCLRLPFLPQFLSLSFFLSHIIHFLSWSYMIKLSEEM